MKRWIRDLALGARLAATGGREGWTRTVLIAVGTGLGVALLLVSAAIPTMLGNRHDRGDARNDTWFGAPLKAGQGTVLVEAAGTTYHDDDIQGRLLRADDPDSGKAPLPPGLTRLPAPGEMVVSPALKRLLDSSGGQLLRPRLPYRIVGTIGDQGLLGPSELAYYAGSDTLTASTTPSVAGAATRIDHFGGYRGTSGSSGESFGAVLVLLVVMIFVILLVPVAVFIGTAARFGGERRDRRLAALRLVGADSGMTRRIAAGEGLFGSLLGLLIGGGLFLLARQLIGSITLWNISAFPSDVSPGAGLTALIVVAVPAATVLVTLLAMGRIAVEPLGVVRNTTPRKRRLWWRLLLPLAGLALLAPLFGRITGTTESINRYQVATGATLLLLGLTAVLPWLVEAVVGRLNGGPLPWQLATRRIQLSSSAAARMVSGVTVAVAGAIALQMLFSNVQGDFTQSTGADPSRAQLMAVESVDGGAQAQSVIHAFQRTAGVRSVLGIVEGDAAAPGAYRKPDEVRTGSVQVADCASLREVLTISSCKDGAVFLAPAPPDYGSPDFKAGSPVDLRVPPYTGEIPKPELWTIPASARTVHSRVSPDGNTMYGVFATPAALDATRLSSPRVEVMLRTDHTPDTVERARNTSASIDPNMFIGALETSITSHRYDGIRRGLFAGATATLILIGASLLVSMLEQLRERRRLLAVLVAFGTRRSTLGLSVLWQTALPVVLGLSLAVAGGIGLGSVLLKMINEPIRVHWTDVATMTGVGAGVVLLVTLISLPPLWRMMRPDGLRTE